MFSYQVSYRYVTAAMIFVASCSSFMMRTNLNVNLVAMVPLSNNTYSESQTILNWTAYQRANILSIHLWGDIVACLIGGPVAASWSSRYAVILGIFIGAVLSMFTPMAAKHSYLAMLLVRFALGFFTGFINPVGHALISRWAVATDKGKFSGALMGGSIGVFIAWTVCGLLIEPLGWEWGFYFFGIICFALSILLWFFIYDSPQKHPYISDSEKQYLSENINVKYRKTKIPFSRILTSIPFWSLAIINFGSGWGIFFVITAAPTYIANALGFNISSTGILSALTYLAKSTFAFAFGSTGDYLLINKLITLPVLRKTGIFISHIIPGCGLMGMAALGMPPAYYITLITSVMALNGAVTLTSSVNGHDLSRNFAGTVSGIVYACMTVAGIIAPYITAFFTKSNETNASLWQPVFFTGGAVFMATGLQFIIFGSTQTQPWNEIKTKPENLNDDGPVEKR